MEENTERIFENMKVLSLCDGMSCGQIALERLGIKVDEYYAAEIKEIGIKVTKANYPNTIHIGDVNKISYKDGILYTEVGNFNVGKIDLVMFGSPC
jgi:site-specific DNA-cytosine methylase